MLAALLLGTVTALALTSPAWSQVRTAEVADARDVPESIGGPRKPDIEQVRVSYDPAGSLSVTVRLFEPWSSTSRTYPTIDMRIGSVASPTGSSCTYGSAADVSFLGYLDPENRFSQGAIGLSGYDGSVPAERSFSADGLETTFTVSAPALHGRQYICVGSIRLSLADPDGHCVPSLANCERIAYVYVGDTADDVFFAGFAPPRPACGDGVDNEGDGRIDLADPQCTSSTGASEGAPPAACGNGRDDDGDGRADLADPGCGGSKVSQSEADPAPVRSRIGFSAIGSTRTCRLDVVVEAIPDLRPAKLFRFGRAQLRIRGVSSGTRHYRKTLRFALHSTMGYGVVPRLRPLRPGRYRLAARYLGDAYRKASPTRSRTISVCGQKQR